MLRLVDSDGRYEDIEVKDITYYARQIAENVQAAETSQLARNQINVALSAIYWKWGKTEANRMMDTYALGTLGWKQYN